METAEGIVPPLQRLAVQRLGGSEVALGLQQRAEVVAGAERARMKIAKGLNVALAV